MFLLFLQEVTLPLISLASEMICSPLTRVNGVSRCSYNKKVPCPSPGSDDRQSEERPEVFANKTLEEVCGRVLSQSRGEREEGQDHQRDQGQVWRMALAGLSHPMEQDERWRNCQFKL